LELTAPVKDGLLVSLVTSQLDKYWQAIPLIMQIWVID
jgi:hypothetical protein